MYAIIFTLQLSFIFVHCCYKKRSLWKNVLYLKCMRECPFCEHCNGPKLPRISVYNNNCVLSNKHVLYHNIEYNVCEPKSWFSKYCGLVTKWFIYIQTCISFVFHIYLYRKNICLPRNMEAKTSNSTDVGRLSIILPSFSLLRGRNMVW